VEFENFCVKLKGLEKFPISYEKTVPWKSPFVVNFMDWPYIPLVVRFKPLLLELEFAITLTSEFITLRLKLTLRFVGLIPPDA
jgi:hypothetical protein